MSTRQTIVTVKDDSSIEGFIAAKKASKDQRVRWAVRSTREGALRFNLIKGRCQHCSWYITGGNAAHLEERFEQHWAATHN